MHASCLKMIFWPKESNLNFIGRINSAEHFNFKYYLIEGWGGGVI